MATNLPRKRARAGLAAAATIDFYDYAALPAPRPGRPVKNDLQGWRVVDDWPERVPVTDVEADVLEAWFADILDELFGPYLSAKRPLLHYLILITSSRDGGA